MYPLASFRSVPGLMALALLALAPASARALSPKIFVASYGNDASDGSRGAPKRTFQAAHDAVAVAGSIVALDTAGYGTLTTTKSVNVTAPPGISAFVTASGIDGIRLYNDAADIVTLRGLIIEGPGVGEPYAGVLTGNIGTLQMEDCTIRNFGSGISSNSGTGAHLIVRHCSIRDVYNGIFVAATGVAQKVDGTVTDSLIDGASNTGITVTASGSGTTTTLTVRNCVVTHCVYGLFSAGTGATRILAADNILSHNTHSTYTTATNIVNSYGGNVRTDNTNNAAFANTFSPE